MTPPGHARIHLLPAKGSPFVVVIRRKPSRCFHIIRWNTKTDELEHGSWFRGKLFPKRCDVSYDGQWLVYLAMGADGNTWNGICRLPFLRAVAEAPNSGTWYGGGYWSDPKTLMLNQWQPQEGSVPFKLRTFEPQFGGEDLGVLYPRWERDGWKRCGDNHGTDRPIPSSGGFKVECDGDDGWRNRPSNEHATLFVKFVGYLKHGYTFRFSLDGYPGLLDEKVDSACWDSLGNLLYSRKGVLYKYAMSDLATGRSGSRIDLELLAPES